MGEKVRVLRTVKSDLTSYGGFKYPEWDGEPVYVECPNWKLTEKCLYGLHGITKDINGYPISEQYKIYDLNWIVLEVNSDDIINTDNGRIKFKCGNIIYCGHDAKTAILMVFDTLEDYIKTDKFGERFLIPNDEIV